MHKYFLAYVWSVGKSSGHGNCVTDTTGPIRNTDHIGRLAYQIEQSEKRLPIGARVTITNIVSLDWP